MGCIPPEPPRLLRDIREAWGWPPELPDESYADCRTETISAGQGSSDVELKFQDRLVPGRFDLLAIVEEPDEIPGDAPSLREPPERFPKPDAPEERAAKLRRRAVRREAARIAAVIIGTAGYIAAVYFWARWLG